ncbi:MAG: AzlD domain-containing protein [Spirochaetales bacterium]|nr:AzlD domain-containing protein [Spirochaetales bacterium]
MPWNELSVCLIVAAVTVLIRILPFAVSDLSGKKRRTAFTDRLSRLLTPALIGMLVIYCLKDVSFENASAAATAISLAICVGTYIWKRSTLLSIVLPTIVYMVLIRVL